MNKMISIFRAGAACLLTMMICFLGLSLDVNATEVEGTVAAIVVVDSYSLEGGIIEAGKDITVNLKVHNTGRYTSATNVLLTVSSNSGLIYPAFGNDNQFFIGTLAAGASETVAIPLTVSQSYEDQNLDLICTFDYASSNTRMNNSAIVVIPTSGGGSVEIKSINVSSHATVNGDSLLSISYANRTAEKIADAEILVSGNVSVNSRVIKLDPIKAGKSYSEDCKISFIEEGDQEIEVVFAYTDIDGQRVENNLGKFSVDVEEESTVSEEDDDQMMTWIGRGIAIAGLLFALVASIWYIKKR